jgi:uncharacterized protein YerC
MDKNSLNKINLKNIIGQKIKLPDINNYSSIKEWENACWNKILESKELLSLFITPYERRNLIKRVAVIDKIISGKSYREISKELSLSLQTIGVIKKVIVERVYRSYFERSKTERKKRNYSVNPTSPKKIKFGSKHRTKYGILYY